jgi:hypothetical protein
MYCRPVATLYIVTTRADDRRLAVMPAEATDTAATTIPTARTATAALQTGV